MISALQTTAYKKIARSIMFYTLFILTIILLLFVYVYPYSVQESLQLNSDEAFHAREIWELLQGRGFFQYYEGVNYHGILGGLAAIPFYKFLGIYPVPFKLPAIIFYGFFIWTTFLILRTFNPFAGWVATIFLLLPPPWVIHSAVILNVPFALIFFLGNLPFLYLIKKKLNHGSPYITTFLLAFYSGLAIYAFTYSILHIFTVGLVFALTHPKWSQIRPYLSIRTLAQPFVKLKTKPELLIRILETIIFIFLLAIIYSYIFGGFGLDIGGITLFQINNLHKPVIQVAILICCRLIFIKKYPLPIASLIKSKVYSATPLEKKIVLIGTTGFVLGISPRILSLIDGSVNRGGQGFDMDFSPIRLISHFYNLISIRVIEVMNLGPAISSLSLEGPSADSSIIQAIFLTPLTLLVGFATYSFISSRWNTIKKIIRLESIKFDPTLILLIYPAALCGSTIITMNGPDLKYLVPLYWIVTIYVAIFISRTHCYSKSLAIALIGVWLIFYGSFSADQKYDLANWKEVFAHNKNSPTQNLVIFLKANGIIAIYSWYGVTSEIIMASNGEIVAADYSRSARGKRLRRELEKYANFSIATHSGAKSIFLKYLKNNKIIFRLAKVDGFIVIWGLKGDPQKINQLRKLIT